MKRGNGQPHTKPKVFPAPVRGWVDSDNPLAPGEVSAAVLENWLPGRDSIRLRGGSQAVSVLSGSGTTLWDYDNGTVQKLFAATASAIHDASLRDGSAAPVERSAGNGNWSTVQFTATGKTYLYAVNGQNNPQLYDGTTWQPVNDTSTPIAITGGPGTLSYVWVFKSRLFFVRKDTMQVVFLPTGLVGGAAQQMSLTGVFQKGGRILFGTTWSSDSGSGFGDRCVIVTDNGEVAIFEGDDPADAAKWRLVSRYEMPPPLGKDAHVRVGGDVLIATTAGLLPLSVIGRDPMALASAAVSAPISRAWRRSVEANRTDWSVMRWDGPGVILVTRPTEPRITWGVVAETGAWFKIVGWDLRRAAMHKGRLHFVGAEGIVRQGDITGQDDGAPFVGRYRGLMDTNPLGLKTVGLHKALFRGLKAARFSLRFITRDRGDFQTTPGPWPVYGADSRWDVGLWDVATWQAEGDEVVTIEGMWQASGATGQKIAPELQVVSDDPQGAVCEYVGCEAMIAQGGLVV